MVFRCRIGVTGNCHDVYLLQGETEEVSIFTRLQKGIYDGIQYTYMAPIVFEDGHYDYVQEHLRILSGFYGVVKPMDGVVPYRLEMQAKAAVDGCKNLYDFWGDDLYREVVDDSHILIGLASKEYSKCIEKYLQPEDRYITCVFGEPEGEKIVQKGVYCKDGPWGNGSFHGRDSGG